MSQTPIPFKRWRALNGHIYDNRGILIADCCCGENPIQTALEIVKLHNQQDFVEAPYSRDTDG